MLRGLWREIRGWACFFYCGDNPCNCQGTVKEDQMCQPATDAQQAKNWEDIARQYARNAGYWRGRAETAEFNFGVEHDRAEELGIQLKNVPGVSSVEVPSTTANIDMICKILLNDMCDIAGVEPLQLSLSDFNCYRERRYRLSELVRVIRGIA